MRRRPPRVSALVALTLVLAACTHGEAAARDAAAPQAGPAASPEVVFETSRGSFTVRLDGTRAPVSTRNLLAYVKEGFYDGTIFHRVIPDFMIQGGGFTADLKQKATHEPIKNEAANGRKNLRGTVAMARTNVVDSATAQFFINTKDNAQLDHTPSSFGYAVIGEVTAGMDVIEAIRNVPTRCPSWTGEPCTEPLPPGLRDVPKDAVIITRARLK